MSGFLHVNKQRYRSASTPLRDDSEQVSLAAHSRTASVTPNHPDELVQRQQPQQRMIFSQLSTQSEPVPRSTKFAGWLSNVLPLKSTRSASPLKSQATSANSIRSLRNPIIASDKRWFDKATNYLFDTDANVDRSPDDIWVLGLQHPGYREDSLEAEDYIMPEASTSANPIPSATYLKPHQPQKRGKKARLKSLSTSPRTSKMLRRQSQQSQRSDSASLSSSGPQPSPTPTTPQDKRELSPSRSLSPEQIASSPVLTNADEDQTPIASQTLSPLTRGFSQSDKLPSLEQTNGWPPEFFLDFTSRIQLTYRTDFPPILSPPSSTSSSSATEPRSFRELVGNLAQSIGKQNGMGGSNAAAGWTCDTGWGCMLRTGQSLLANALSEIHLGRGACAVFYVN